MKIRLAYDHYWQKRIKESNEDDRDKRKPNEIFQTASSALNGGDRILEVGCGDGSFFHYIKDKFRRLYGTEIAKEAAGTAKKQGITLSLTDLNLSLPYKDNTFDAVSCTEVIEHLLDPYLLLSEIYRVLQPNGQLVLTTPNIRYFRNLYKLIFKGIFPHTTADTFVWGGGHLHHFTRKDINTLLNKTGFKKIAFSINQDQFLFSKKRNVTRFLIGDKIFGEWFCGSITVSAYKEI